MLDPVASISHYFACLAAIFATLILRQLTQNDPICRRSVTIFGLSMIALYGASGTFHAFRQVFWQKVNQSAVCGLIAGTYTPIMVILLPGGVWRYLLWMVWGLTGLGIASIWLLPKQPHAELVGFYLTTGWLGFLGIRHYYQATGLRGMTWAIAGALAYTFGAICEFTNWPVLVPGLVGSHEVMHLATMLATTCHFVFIARFVIPYGSSQERVVGEYRARAAPILSRSALNQ